MVMRYKIGSACARVKCNNITEAMRSFRNLNIHPHRRPISLSSPAAMAAAPPATALTSMTACQSYNALASTRNGMAIWNVFTADPCLPALIRSTCGSSGGFTMRSCLSQGWPLPRSISTAPCSRALLGTLGWGPHNARALQLARLPPGLNHTGRFAELAFSLIRCLGRRANQEASCSIRHGSR